jgi:hypothetical protein
MDVRLRARAVVPLQPQERKADDRDQNVHIENHAGIARREIACCDHLVNVPARGAKEKQRRADYGGEPQVEAAPASQKTDGGEAEACESDLRLERTVRPADKARCHFTEEGVQDEVVEKAETHREYQEIEEQRLDDNRSRPRLGAEKRNERSDQADDEKVRVKFPKTNRIALSIAVPNVA